MNTIYVYALAIGLFFLILSFLLDGLSDIIQGLSYFSISFDIMPGILPVTPLQICAFLTGFGGIGYTIYTYTPFHLLFAIASGLLLSGLTKLLINHLKKVNSEALTDADLIGMEGKVIVTIFEKGVGSVSLDTNYGKITYSAISNKTIKQGTRVKVLDVNNHILIVSDQPIYFLSKN